MDEHEDYCVVLDEFRAEAGRRGMTFQEAMRSATGAWMAGDERDTTMDSNLMPPARTNGTMGAAAAAPRAAVALNGLGWAIEKSGPMPLAGGRGRGVDPDLFAAICALGMPPERMRLDRKKFGAAKLKKILALVAAAEAGAGKSPFTFFKASDGMMIVHRVAARAGGDATTPAALEPARHRAAGVKTEVVIADVLKALDRRCPKPGDAVALVDVDMPCMSTSEGRAAVRDGLRADGRYTVTAPFLPGKPGRTLQATRMR